MLQELDLVAELQERDELEATRTVEDMRRLAEGWLAAALARVNGSAAGFVPNGHANPEQVQAVLAEYLLDTPALVDFIVSKVEARAQLTKQQKESKRKKLDEAIVRVETELREALKVAAHAEVEARFSPEAA